MKIHLGVSLVPFVLGAALLLGGCCGSKIAECNKLIESINRNGQVITKALDKFSASKKTKADAEELGKKLDTVGDEIKAIELKDETLKSSAKEYHDMLDKLSKAAKDATATDAKTQAKALEELEQVTKTEDTIVNKVNSYCGAK
ncbi:MAG: hypothetical protein HY898_10460 [Deltaproteobacteria bacterium]|nr:hypothetical protein [Deltaproteobacteria bacterium]